MNKNDRILGIMILAVAAGLLPLLTLQPAALSHSRDPAPQLNPLVIGDPPPPLPDSGPESQSTTWSPAISPSSLPSIPPQDFTSVDGVLGLGNPANLDTSPEEPAFFKRDTRDGDPSGFANSLTLGLPVDGVIGLGDTPSLEATPAERLVFSRNRGETK